MWGILKMFQVFLVRVKPLRENIEYAYYMMRASDETDSRELNSHISKIGIKVEGVLSESWLMQD